MFLWALFGIRSPKFWLSPSLYLLLQPQICIWQIFLLARIHWAKPIFNQKNSSNEQLRIDGDLYSGSF